jgi:hypothetical protein
MWSGKHHNHGGYVQVITASEGWLIRDLRRTTWARARHHRSPGLYHDPESCPLTEVIDGRSDRRRSHGRLYFHYDSPTSQ